MVGQRLAGVGHNPQGKPQAAILVVVNGRQVLRKDGLQGQQLLPSLFLRELRRGRCPPLLFGLFLGHAGP
jgi:hypothetical protein